jgi:penicillin-binding protein-related factor A (putative recombinase)
MKHVWKDAEDEFELFFARFGKRAAVERLTDTAYVRGATGLKKSIKDAQPADFVVTWEGRMFYAEVKSTANEPSFSFSMISKNQWRAARKAVAAGGDYQFFIRRESTGEWYVIHAVHIIDHDAKSMKWAEIDHHRILNNPLFAPLLLLAKQQHDDQVSRLHDRSGNDGH